MAYNVYVMIENEYFGAWVICMGIIKLFIVAAFAINSLYCLQGEGECVSNALGHSLHPFNCPGHIPLFSMALSKSFPYKS